MQHEEQQIASSYQADLSYDEFIMLLGSSTRPGEIQQLEEEIKRVDVGLYLYGSCCGRFDGG